MSTQILLAEDYDETRSYLRTALEEAGFSVMSAKDGVEALSAFESGGVDLVLSDHQMPRMDGLSLFGEIRKRARVPFILYSASASTEVSFRAGQDGAVGFLDYPFDVATQLIPTIHETLRKQSAPPAPDQPASAPVLGCSAEIEIVRQEVARYAPLATNVLVTGETGTGKEVVARALHMQGSRASLAFVKVNCPAIPVSLFESELFGHEKGAFTGAASSKQGRFELAHQGTIFLDEIGELDLPSQAKLLQVLQEGKFDRVGGTTTLRVDVRVIAATNRDLRSEVAAGRFREDLYFRLAQTTIHIPALRERKDDIEVLATAFMTEFATSQRRPAPSARDEFFDALRIQPWKGNVRELRAAIQRVIIWWDGEKPLDAFGFFQAFAAANMSLDPEDRTECQKMLKAYAGCRGNQEAARRQLGLSRAEWRHRWEKKYGLQVLGRKRRG